MAFNVANFLSNDDIAVIDKKGPFQVIEYKRDLSKGLDIEVPYNYYKNDNPENIPLLTWRAHAKALYTNWLDYYVYQNTPYEW